MRITAINIKNDYQNGLEPINISRLNQHVVIAGKNGSGKSRLLQTIKSTLSIKPTLKQLEDTKKYLENQEKSWMKIQNRIETLSGGNNNSIKQNIEKLKLDAYSLEKGIENARVKLQWNEVVTSELSNNYNCIDFVPKDLMLKDCNSFNKHQMDSNARRLDNVGINNAAECTLSKIQYIQNQWFEATHQNSTINDVRKQEIIQSYERLNK